MTARFFADTNIAVYALDADLQRRDRALAIMRQRPVISTQVINEFISVPELGAELLPPASKASTDEPS